ncbi:MAG: hypothetical protein KF824_05630 [Fimbriimonadaceae bacterium]|nr:MAG: hypothetical protein KF824_05630 [Fimbriimonadaceae bacterium]
MKIVPYPERQKRIREELRAAWEEARKTPEDPGLRETYTSLPRAPIQLVGLQMEKVANHGGILRIAEAYRLEHVLLEREADDVYDLSGERGSTAWQSFEFGEPADHLRNLRNKGYQVVALHLSRESQNIATFNWQTPTAIVFGEEKYGVRPEILELCHHTVAIPLYGMTTSLNVGQAVAIATQYAMQAHFEAHPDFHPARNNSKRILGIPADNPEENSAD